MADLCWLYVCLLSHWGSKLNKSLDTSKWTTWQVFLLEDDKIAKRQVRGFLPRCDTWGLPLKTSPGLCHFNLFLMCLWSFLGHRSVHGQYPVASFLSCGQWRQQLWGPGRWWGKKRSLFLTTYNLIPLISHLFSEISNGWRQRPGLQFMHLRI